MKLALLALTLALAAVATIGEPQYYPMYPNNYYSPYYFRSGESNPWIPQYLPQQRQKQPAASPLAPSGSSPFQPDPSDSRFLFQMLNPTGYTLTISTSTSTAIATAFTTCTTSTAALTTCTAGRRRRGLFYDESAASGRARRGLFYNDKEDDDIFVYVIIVSIFTIILSFIYFISSTVLRKPQRRRRPPLKKLRTMNRRGAHVKPFSELRQMSWFPATKTNGTI